MFKLYTYSNIDACLQYIFELETALYNEERFGDDTSSYVSVDDFKYNILNKYKKLLGFMNIYYTILFDNNKPIGYITYAVNNKIYSTIISLFIDKMYRGKSLSRLLIESAHEHFVNNGCVEAVVCTLSSRRKLLEPFYNKFDYMYEKDIISADGKTMLSLFRNLDVRRSLYDKR